MDQDRSDHGASNFGTDESVTRVDSLVSDPDHPKETHPDDNANVNNFSQHAMKNFFVSDCLGLMDFAVKYPSLVRKGKP